MEMFIASAKWWESVSFSRTRLGSLGCCDMLEMFSCGQHFQSTNLYVVPIYYSVIKPNSQGHQFLKLLRMYSKKDLSYLTNLPCASEKLQIFNADLDLPESFDEAIQGCIGVFHVAHPVDYGEKEPEEIKIQRAINGTLGILKACLDSKTVKRVVYTSSASTIMFNDKGLDVLDENHLSDIDYIRSVKIYGVSYMISMTLTEKVALEFAEKHGLDLVTVIPTVVNGPFICPRVPSSVNFSMAMIFGKKENCKYLGKIQMVHVDDVASAHIFLFEYPHAKGRVTLDPSMQSRPVHNGFFSPMDWLPEQGTNETAIPAHRRPET
ncbi:hypothetical protein TEA_016376 [Camellia sinensis var. sinensis]|uniref:Dihydroflavonol 4-reductase n=1 Tax=Camellia sinensis var. sinensis TaxID=542762 RepID=A0A4S4D4V3_CAMSN|nr:hypothetical protein TEA_016376 [Camellia sinensis var. sinensis]